ncbi:MAG: asparagine synthase (glutamine-hydrolyzing) [Chlorobiaceae bacterium]|jgi:asparagine synthase (glutamine-hydrolysing)|nr:asparagine synthase (glutamine-hydrolyzing) [Chlorobiaceae bacterium]NTV16631.1 asparagine synthase (glutamine-hydrolyzing) [Chlorobiaceae bacterium]
MCGIAGWFNAPQDKHKLETMLRSIRHRGPEGSGIYQSDLVSFGNTRLAFVDLEAGQQPLSNETGTIWLTCNGEIFNHTELRRQLTPRHTFKTLCDVEVILHLYEEHGVEGFKQLNGQYSFALWDSINRKFILCRDRLGICPFFYTFIGETLYFASEIKALLTIPEIPREPDLSVMQDIWTFWTPLPGKTAFKNIFEVLPAYHYTLEFGKRDIKKERYWQLDFTEGKWSEETAKEAFSSIFDDAVKIRLKADVPIASYLSGGVDSSVIGAFANHYASELHTFSITFQHPDYDESEYQLQVARHLGTIHHITRCTADDLASALPKMVWHTEVPQLRAGPISMLPLSENVNRHGLKAVLTGEGADEFFMGYDIFKETAVRQFMARNPGSAMRRSLVRRLYPYLPERDKLRGLELAMQEGLEHTDDVLFSHMFRWNSTARLQGYFHPEVRAGLAARPIEERLSGILPPGFRNWSSPQQAQTLEIMTFMTPYLLSSQGDRVAMANGIEGRFPFLDHRLIEFANSLPQTLKLRSLKQDKYVLRRVAETMLPDEIAKRTKFPYRAPIQDIFKSKSFDNISDLLSEKQLNKTGLFSTQAAQKLLNKARAGQMASEMEQMALMGIVTTQLWHHTFIQNNHL